MNASISLLILSLFGFSFAATPQNSELDRSSYTFPFESHQAWINTMAGKGLKDWSVVFDKSTFDRFHQGETVKVERIQYPSDGLNIKGFLIHPKDTSKRYPLIVFNRGGTLQWSRITFWEILEFCRLAEQGYVIAASYFRGCGGSEGTDSLGDGAVRDVLRMIELVDDLPFVDPSRMGMWGFSRGSITTYHCLTREKRISAAVTVGGVTDHFKGHRQEEFATHVYPQALPAYSKDPKAALRSISAFHWAEKLNPETPILLIHGAGDKRVLPDQSQLMAGKLQELGRPYRLVILENGSHSLVEHVTLVRAQLDDWFGRYVKQAKTAQ